MSAAWSRRFADHGDLPRQNRRRHEIQADLAHLLAEAGHRLRGDGERRLGVTVAPRRACAARREHEIAADHVDEFDERGGNGRASSWIRRVSVRHGVASASPSHVSSDGMPLSS